MSQIEEADLESQVTVLRGVGAERAAQLARLEIRTVHDLLRHRPRGYEDRTRIRRIAELQEGELAVVSGRVAAQGIKRWRGGSRSVFELVLDDGTGRLHCCWWDQPYHEGRYPVGSELIVCGKPRLRRPWTVDHPDVEVVEPEEEGAVSAHVHRWVPVYPLTEGMGQRWLRGLIWRTKAGFGPLIQEPKPAFDLGDLPDRAAAIRQLHFPESPAQGETARQRLALDEFLALQHDLQQRRRRLQENARGIPCAGDNRLMRPFLRCLGFALTDAQTRVLREIRLGLGGRWPMRRLLQGDVGSGKTVVAGAAALMAIESGCDVALMAPTEILAEQHALTFRRWLEPLGLRVELRTHSAKPVEAVQGGPPGPGLCIGTHALLESGFSPPNLGLVIIDEQHRFGVAQRERLVRKGRYPHLLVMTATPIPRTLGLTVYGDLDVSILDAAPPSRGTVKTFVRSAERLPKVWAFVRQQLAAGRQAYVVYPRVEEQDLKTGLKAVTAEQARLREALAPHPVALLHGRLPTPEKDEVMAAFREGRVKVLMATSVIEVGIDVPNATVMVVENAERYGLAQLHQLRGRIGRGGHTGHCILVAAARTREARRRLEVLARTTDGFRIAEEDLRLRGPGELLGQSQSGLPRFRFGDLAADLDLVQRARALVQSQAARSPHVFHPPGGRTAGDTHGSPNAGQKRNTAPDR